jgi:hypothetical protein
MQSPTSPASKIIKDMKNTIIKLHKQIYKSALKSDIHIYTFHKLIIVIYTSREIRIIIISSIN